MGIFVSAIPECAAFRDASIGTKISSVSRNTRVASGELCVCFAYTKAPLNKNFFLGWGQKIYSTSFSIPIPTRHSACRSDVAMYCNSHFLTSYGYITNYRRMLTLAVVRRSLILYGMAVSRPDGTRVGAGVQSYTRVLLVLWGLLNDEWRIKKTSQCGNNVYGLRKFNVNNDNMLKQ